MFPKLYPQIALTLCILLLQLSIQAPYLCSSQQLSSLKVGNLSIPLFTEQQLNADLMKPENMDNFELAVYHEDLLRIRSNIANLTHLAIQARLYMAVYNDLLMQRYDNRIEFMQSGGPKANQDLCLEHLEKLINRTEALVREEYTSRDVVLAELLDTFGKRPSGLYLGAGYWTGSYKRCNRIKINITEEVVSTRYCVAHVRPRSFASDESSPLKELSVFKSGVCLPESCDSLKYKNKFELIFRLMELNSHDFSPNQANFTHLYCPPDSKSPLRTWWLQPSTMATLVALLSWTLLVVCATFNENLFNNQKDGRLGRIFRCLSLRTNLSLLFKTLRVEASDGSDKQGTTTSEKSTQVEQKKITPIIDLKMVDGIKVLTIVYIIMGHVIMCMMHMIIVNDSQDTATWALTNIANMAPAFAVNSFFAITGLLTTYMMFKLDTRTSILTSPVKWIVAIVYRYLRIMSLYVIVVAYAKYLAKYTGSGPLWDYGTSSLAHRRNCEQESWLVTLLFTSNFKPPNSHCLPVGWYLANDFHFFLVTPFFLYILKVRPLLGKIILVLSISAGYWASFVNIITADLEDLRPIAHFMPHGFKSYATLMHTNYTRPQYRIPAYLCGLLAGYYLYEHEQQKLRYLAVEEKPNELQVSDSCQKPDWPQILKKFGNLASLFVILTISAMPYFSYLVPLDRTSARILMALIVPYNHISYSISISILVLLNATGDGYSYLRSFLSAGFWRPLAKLSLCVCLINCEVIIYITQSMTQFVYFDSISHVSLNMISVVICYLVGIVLFVLFEAPTRHFLDYLLFKAH